MSNRLRFSGFGRKYINQTPVNIATAVLNKLGVPIQAYT